MQPYYSDGQITLYHGDMVDVVGVAVHKGSVHTTLTDPPFFMPAAQYAGRTATWQRTWSDTSVLAQWWKTATEVMTKATREDGHLLTFCDHASYAVFYPAIYTRWPNITCLTWDKGRPGMGTTWRGSSELIIAARGREAYWNGGAKGTVLNHSPVHHTDRLHPVDKPVGLLRELLSATTPSGGLVLDPFAGSGSALIAARGLGLRAIGVELEESYCEVIATRFAAGVLPFEEVA